MERPMKKNEQAYGRNKETFDKHRDGFGNLRFVNEEFGRLFRKHLSKVEFSYQGLLEHLSLSLPVGKGTIAQNLLKYQAGNLLGSVVFLTPGGLTDYERHIGRLIHVLKALDVKPDSEMLGIIREETGLEFTYPPREAYAPLR